MPAPPAVDDEARVPVRHLILDRDGVLNREAADGGYILHPGEFHWLPGAREALALLHGAGLSVSVVTNQSGVGRGLMTAADLDAVHAKMRREAAAAGGELTAVFACPHAPGAGCACRKPAPGLVLAAIEASGIGPAQTLVAGDDLRDLEAAAAAGVRAVLLRTGKGARAEDRLHGGDGKGRPPSGRGRPVPVYDDLLQLARALVSGAG